MNKSELTRTIATEAGVSNAMANKILGVALSTVTNTLMQGEKVTLRGFGVFRISERAARRCGNPQTKKIMIAPAHRTVRFSPSTEIKGRLN